MGRKSIPPKGIESRSVKVFLPLVEWRDAELEQQKAESEAKSGAANYFRFLRDGEMLMKRRRWEQSRDALIQSAQIALSQKEPGWLVLSHERLGDLSAAEGNWFGALHHYRYALRTSSSFKSPPPATLEAKAAAAQSTLRATVLSQDHTITALSKEYRAGNMTISFVHRDIFLKNYFARCLECNFCQDWCCSFGADIDLKNVEKIQQRRDEILPFVRPPEGEWFDTETAYYEEYAGNQYTRINPQGPRCAFISKDQRGCGLHRYAISQQMDYHEIKPLVCILFPLSFGEGILCLAPELDDNSLICAGSGDSAYRSLRSELEYYFGLGLVDELDGMETEILSGR